MAVRNVVFDMGQVLLRFDGMLFARIFTEGEKDATLLDRALFSSPTWALLDAGVVDEATMERVARASLPRRLWDNLHDALCDWDLHQPAIPETNVLVERIHGAGLGLYLLSNAGLRFERAHRRIPTWDLFDGWVVSAFERLMKPDARIYTLLCDRYELDPATCLFVDDNPNNVRGAEAAGMQGHLFEGADGLERDLRERDAWPEGAEVPPRSRRGLS